MARRPLSKYVSVEASEDESEVTSEDLDDVAEVSGTTRDWAKLTRELEQKYIDVEEETEEEEEETVEQGIKQSSLVPRKTSPRLFLVRAKRGSERDITARIVQNEPKNVFSVVCKDGLKGYIYIEAFQKQHVMDALESLKGVERTKISVVPQNEMIEALTYRESEGHGEWGRVRKGKYKNDLVKIMGMEGDMVRVRVVPRIGGERRLFNPEGFKDSEVVRSGGEYIYKRDTYVDGFLEKDVLRSSIDFDIEPTFAELEDFRQSCSVCVGDRVRVTRGELIGVRGVVKGISGGVATVQGEEEAFDVQSSSLVRHLEVGEVVSFGGENGVVVKADGRECVVAIRDFTEEVKVNIEDVKAPVAAVTGEGQTTQARQSRARRDPLVNMEVVIQCGDYKGYRGVVKEVYKNICRVQLNSNMKFVSVERDSVTGLDSGKMEGEYYRDSGYRTPGYKTPGYKTPGYKTPGYRTPGYRAGGMELGEETGTEWLTGEGHPFRGTLITIGGSEVALEDYKDGRFMTKNGVFGREEVAFVMPQKNDLVCVLDGEKKGTSGVLIAINDNFGVVRSSNGPVIHLPMEQISKKLY